MSVVLAAAGLLVIWAALMSSRAPGRDRLMRIVPTKPPMRPPTRLPMRRPSVTSVMTDQQLADRIGRLPGLARQASQPDLRKQHTEWDGDTE